MTSELRNRLRKMTVAAKDREDEKRHLEELKRQDEEVARIVSQIEPACCRAANRGETSAEILSLGPVFYVTDIQLRAAAGWPREYDEDKLTVAQRRVILKLKELELEPTIQIRTEPRGCGLGAISGEEPPDPEPYWALLATW